MGRDDVLAVWFYKSDEATSEFIRQAAIDSLQRSEPFFAPDQGMPELHNGIAG